MLYVAFTLQLRLTETETGTVKEMDIQTERENADF